MKILVVSNLYPPHYVGGYELGCKYVLDKLKERGHQVRILTSTYGVDQPQDDGEVCRKLKYSPWKPLEKKRDLLGVIKKESYNQSIFKKELKTYRPDMVYIWNLAHLSSSLAFIAEEAAPKVSYFISDSWLARIERDPWYSFWGRKGASAASTSLKSMLCAILNSCGISSLEPPVRPGNVQFVSGYMRDETEKAGIRAAASEVIHWGVDADKFPYKKESNPAKRLLYVGHIMKHKGVDTAIKAVDRLANEHGYAEIELSVIGGTTLTEYEGQMREMVISRGLEKNIKFKGAMTHEEVVKEYQAHDILIFPSVWGEPFSITLIEGMASGLAVVATPTGGSAEILENEDNALVFEANDDAGCSRQILRLLEEEELFERLRKNARSNIETNFTFEGMVDKIENNILGSVSI